MGNHKFKLSDMIPNAWFYKLKDMSNRSKTQYNHHSINKKHLPISSIPPSPPPRLSYYHTSDSTSRDKFFKSPVNPKASDTHFPDPPRIQPNRRHRKKRGTKACTSNPLSPSVSLASSCRASSEIAADVTLMDEFDGFTSWSSSGWCKVTSTATDIVMDIESKSPVVLNSEISNGGFDSISELGLPPILTKPPKLENFTVDPKKRKAKPSSKLRNCTKVGERSGHVSHLLRESFSLQKLPSPGFQKLKTRGNSPRLASRKIQAFRRVPSRGRREIVSESYAVVKSSVDPQRDFRESMVEMIMENNIRASKDLENLLACYLSLNSCEYHDVIVKVFKQIWFDLSYIRL